jgi:hypothetical protein
MHHLTTQPLHAALAGATLVLLVAACGGTPAASVQTDPKAILTTAVENAAQAKTVHVDVAASGNLPVNLGLGSAGLDLSGTTASADVDLKAPAAHATFDAPGLLGVRGELIAVDGKTYVKTSLTGPQFREQSGGSLPSASGEPAASAGVPAAGSMVQQLQDFLSKPGVDPTLGADAPCGSATCSTVQIQLTPAELAALQSESGVELPTANLPVDVGDLSNAGVDLTFHVTKDTNRLFGVTAVVDMQAGASGAPAASTAPGASSASTITLDLTFSKWDDPVTVTAPPADQIAPAG